MIRAHEIKFPRFAEDILSHKRTLAHLPFNWQDEDGIRIGDRLLFFSKITQTLATRIERFGTIVSVSYGVLRIEESDLPLLNVGSAVEYLDRWDALHPNAPASGFPKVRRLEWVYGDPRPESTPDPTWCLAG